MARDKAILDTLQSGRKSAQEIADALGTHPMCISQSLGFLRRQGLIKKGPRGPRGKALWWELA